MKKKLLFLTALVLIQASLPFGIFSAMATDRSWSDGDPTFTQTIVVGEGVDISDIITLQPQSDFSASAESLGVILHGLMWQWPRADVELVSAKDVDYRKVANQELFLITDALANRVFEYNATERREIWSFGNNKPGTPNYLDRPVDADIYKESDLFTILVTDQGRNRILKVDKESQSITWFYGDPNGGAGNNSGQLNSPSDAEKIVDSDEIVIADRGNSRVIIVNETDNSVIWQYGPGEVGSPVDVEYVPELESLLITDQSLHRVILVRRSDKEIIWQFGVQGTPLSGTAGLNAPIDADYLSSGTILIADANNERMLEVDMEGEVVWQFHRPLPALQDVDRLADNRHLIINDLYPSLLGYTDSLIVLQEMDLGDDRKVIFDRIHWSADTNGETEVFLQMRSGNSLSALRDGPWLGPQGAGSFYTSSGQQLNPAHYGHSLYQIRAFLQTTDHLKTPILQNIRVDYHYYRTKQTSVFRSPNLPLTSGPFLNRWKKVTLHTRLPDDPALRSELGLDFIIRNAQTGQFLVPFTASRQLNETIIVLDSYPELLKVPSIYIEGRVTTNLPYVTPILEDWTVEWQEIVSSTSALRFVNSAGSQVDVYRATPTLPATEDKVDSIRILFSDPDVQAFQNTVTLGLFSKLSRDSLDVELELNPVTGFFANRPIPILISDKVDRKNGILEVDDRDTLIVQYIDADDPSDISADTVLIVKNTTGELLIENSQGLQLTTVQPGDTLYIRVRDENDRNIRPDVQEQIRVAVYDNTTGDREELTLIEVQDDEGGWDSGEFVLANGLAVVIANNGVRNDGKLQTLRGHRITAEYLDNVALIQSVLVPGDPNPPNPITIEFGGEPFIVEVAPNPYFEQRHSSLKMRIAAAFGSINIRYFEVFNLAGELVRRIDPDKVYFDQPFPMLKNIYARAENWWDLRNDNGNPVAGGTYFLKVHADITNDETNTHETRAFIRKFVVVR
ncbi:hypothetical protein JW992_10490 [candidate division KSB1 bacterium]|nr:hypothetical protein [candidate division KSB1 bacterium]